MSAATKYAAKKNLQELVPLNALSESSFKEIAPKIVIEEVRSGHYLFHKGDHDNQAVYLLDGKVDLVDGHKKITGGVEAGTDICRYPVANQQPRPLSARAVTRVVIARIDSMLLDAFLNWDHTSVAEATEINADDNEDWMTRILQSEAFIKIPPAIIQRLIISMQPFPVRAGDVVIRQGEEGDYFYSIHKGRCAVTRRESPDGKDLLLSELSAGDFFGEESLLLASRRNASITMLTDGVLMRLGKKDFVDLLQKPLVKSVTYEVACTMVEEGAVWIDVRSAEEYAGNSFEDSVNIPLTELRDQIPELVFNAKYVICCDTGHRSISAAFVLSHKGFEAYVLKGGLKALTPDAGMQLHTGKSAARSVSGENDRPGAEIIAFSHGVGENVGEDAALSHMSGDMAQAQTVDQLAELVALRGELDELRKTDLQRQEVEARLAELQSELAGQQDIIDETSRVVSALRTDLENTAGEKILLQEQYDAALKSHAEQLGHLEQELERSTTLINTLRTEIAAAEKDRLRLQDLAGSAEADRDARFARLVDENSKLAQQRDELQAESEAARERAARIEDEHASFLGQQNRQQENLQEELAQAKLRIESLHAELLQKAQQHGESETSLRQQQRTVETLSKELAGSRQQLASLEAELAAAREHQPAPDEGADAELAQRLAELECLRGELAQAREHGSELAGRIADEENRVRTVQQQLDDLAARHEEQQGEFSSRTELLQQQHGSALAEMQALSEQLASLQQDNESLLGENERLLSESKEQSALVERLTTEKQTADDANLRLQNDWKAEREELLHRIETGNTQLVDIEARLGRSAEEAGREKLQLQEELQAHIEAHREQLEQHTRHQEELQQEQKRATEILQALTAERDDLQTRLDCEIQEGAAQQLKIEELDALVDSLRSTADRQAQELGGQFENERRRADVAESQLESLRMELSVQQEKDTGLVVDIENLQKQEEELRRQLHETEERFRSRDLENQDALKKLYDDLVRKNETEKELQGQIERLRKKLDQSEEALQAARHDERESVENIRNELNAERRARAEERAQMAARQRELKEQLVSVASQHEEVIATRDGVLAQARDDAREEERTRLGQVIAMQQQMELQLTALQDELRQAHEETASAVRQERASNEADLELARRQKADADAALGQLEIQLKQLMEERDAALAERQSVRDQLNTLRAEVEVARGLVNAEKQGLGGDPIRLISELKETRRNIEIAVRLRTEAESQRDQAIAQLEALRHGQDGSFPSADRQPANNGPARQDTTQQPAQQGVPATGTVSSGSGSAIPTEIISGRGRSSRIWFAGLGMVVLAAITFWFMPRMEIPGALNPGDARPDIAAPAETTPANPARVQAVVEDTPEPAVVTPEVTPHRAAGQSSQPEPAASHTPATDNPEPAGLAAVRSFRDTLSGGGDGPLMVQLPAAGYQMGSAGNSLNFEERPQHQVDLPTFAIGKYEISFAEYDRFVQATGRRLPPDEGWGRDDRPVINVSWNDAEAYASWLSEQTGHHYRVPSESEWEFAARGDTTSAFWWDGLLRQNPANCFDCGSRWDGTSTAPVGSFQANRFGLHDTSGNVQEWTGDCYHPNYQDAPSDGSAWQSPGCTQRVVRGGSYTSPLDSVRSARRGKYDQDTRLDNLGFRVVRVD